MKKYSIIFLGMILLYPLVFTQYSFAQTKSDFTGSNSKVQYGFSLKSSLEFNTPPGGHVYFRIVANAGIGTSAIWKYFYPSYNLELQLYDGGLGSMACSECKKGHYFSFDIINAFTGTFSLPGKRKHFQTNATNEIREPLYYFGNFCNPALENPYWNSLSVGSDFMNSLSDNWRRQRAGFFNMHFNDFQAGYVNDGGFPFDYKPVNLGDTRDRYYTTIVTMSYQIKPDNQVNLFELSYCKFTGYTKNAFEISNNLDLNYVHYADMCQHYYSYGYIAADVSSTKRGWDLSLKDVNDYPLDLQKLVHYDIYNPFHKSPYPHTYAAAINYFAAINYIPRR